ncbi:2'-5' RNA ligase family protein [Actinomadura sp. SCN-SB]|uniref:2'-5' RNA ligase family protein n=1 Tax=Actinomadura sp. SCN-SB TaxID=3373092 RepID=UPI003750AE58
MSPLPVEMRDRWADRAETPPGKGTVYWHILMGGYPEVRSTAERVQKQLGHFTGLHMTPLHWLHMTALVVGSTDDITQAQMNELIEHASNTLSGVTPIEVSLGRILYHPEAIMLGIEPDGALDPIFNAARTSTQTVLGWDGVTTSGQGNWIPHMTLCYSTAKQAAKPLIATVGLNVPECHVTIRALTLVVQWGPERDWNWHKVGAAPLEGIETNTD